MNRTIKADASETPTRLMGTLAIMGFAAEHNLRDVTQALGQRDLGALSRVVQRNEKQARLRAEVEERVVEAMAQPTVGSRERRKLILVSQVALMFERMGAQTVEIASLSGQVILQPKSNHVPEIKKLIEHAVYITDRAATGLVEEDIHMARIAREQKRAADELHVRVQRDISVCSESQNDSAVRANLLCNITCKAYGIIEEAGKLADDVIAFLEKAEL